MSFQGLQERLAALQETTAQLKELIDRLANLEFQPGAVPQSVGEDSSASGELSTEIGYMLRGGLEEQELLQEEVRDLRSDGFDKTRLQEEVELLGKELVSSRFALRRARLSAKKNLEQAQRLERELVMQSFSAPASEEAPGEEDQEQATVHHPPRHIQKPEKRSGLSENDQQTVGASNNVTNALRRTHDLIATELSRSEFAHQTLTESSATLRRLDESYGSLDTLLASSRDLLGTLLRSQKSDTWYLQTSLYMLAVTGVWLVFRRLLYGPTWWLLWMPARLLFGLGSRAGGAVMQGGAAPGESGHVGDAGGRAAVEGLPGEDVPTAKVGRGEKPGAGGDDPDSLVEKVGEIVNAANEADDLGSIPRDAVNQHDTNDEVREGRRTAVEGERPRDEL